MMAYAKMQGDFCCRWNAFLIIYFLSFSCIGSDHKTKLTPDNSEIQESLDEQNKILYHLLKDYEKRLIPAVPGKPLNVSLHVKIYEIFSLDDHNMESEMTLYIRQTWHDFRLSHNHTAGKIKVREHLLDKIWIPDIRIRNLKDIKRFHDFGGINMNIYKDGRIYFSQLAHVKISCPMDLRKFPLDKQTCFLNFTSYAYSTSLMRYILSKKKVVINLVDLPQFDFVDAKQIQHNSFMPKITIAITFQRRSGYYFVQVYLPSIFLVVLSWLVFFMESSDIGNRLALEVTMILSIVFLLGSINTTLPRVSYPKASDWFVIVSFTFIFFALLETMFVYRLTQSQNQHNRFIQRKKTNTSSSSTEEECSTLSLERPRVGVQVEMKPTRSWVDTICIIAFPVSYVVFNLFYWCYYIR